MTNDYQSRKCSLRAVLRGPASVERIQDAVRRCDTLWIHCLLFIKGFLLNKYEQDPEREQDLPRDHQFSESKKIKSTINSVLLGYGQSVGAHWGGH